MPSITVTGMANRYDKKYVICFWCKRPVGKIQEKKGKAFCYRCQQAIFYPKREERPLVSKGRRFTKEELEPKPKKMMTPEEWIKKYRKSDDYT